MRRTTDYQQIEIVGYRQDRLADLNDLHTAMTSKAFGYGVGDPLGVAEHGFVDDESSNTFSLAPGLRT